MRIDYRDPKFAKYSRIRLDKEGGRYVVELYSEKLISPPEIIRRAVLETGQPVPWLQGEFIYLVVLNKLREEPSVEMLVLGRRPCQDPTKFGNPFVCEYVKRGKSRLLPLALWKALRAKKEIIE
ncbi:MAG: hypothetical protein WAV21_03695 [Minisyncoccia bacterium]